MHSSIGEQSAVTDLFLTMKEHFLSVPDLLGHWAKEVNLWMVSADQTASSVINTLIEGSLCNF